MNTATASPRFHLGIVTGLQFESAIAEDAIRSATALPGDDRVTATCHGPGQLGALSAAKSLVGIRAGALLSFGVAGGCNPDLPSGTVVLATGIRVYWRYIRTNRNHADGPSRGEPIGVAEKAPPVRPYEVGKLPEEFYQSGLG